MTIVIRSSGCKELGELLAEQSSNLQTLCENLNSRIIQTRNDFKPPNSLKQAYFVYTTEQLHDFTITTEKIGIPLAVIEDSLTKEMLTSYLYQICAVLAQEASQYLYQLTDIEDDHRYNRAKLKHRALELMDSYHIAALRMDLQQAMSTQ